MLLGRPFQSGEILVHGTVEGLELLLRESVLVLVADVDAGLLERVDEGGIGADVSHRLNKDCADRFIGQPMLSLPAFMPLRHGNIIAPYEGPKRGEEGRKQTPFPMRRKWKEKGTSPFSPARFWVLILAVKATA